MSRYCITIKDSQTRAGFTLHYDTMDQLLEGLQLVRGYLTDHQADGIIKVSQRMRDAGLQMLDPSPSRSVTPSTIQTKAPPHAARGWHPDHPTPLVPSQPPLQPPQLTGQPVINPISGKPYPPSMQPHPDDEPSGKDLPNIPEHLRDPSGPGAMTPRDLPDIPDHPSSDDVDVVTGKLSALLGTPQAPDDRVRVRCQECHKTVDLPIVNGMWASPDGWDAHPCSGWRCPDCRP